MHGYGFDEITEIGGKLASGRVRSDYTDHLAALGLYTAYRQFVRAKRAPGLAPAPGYTRASADLERRPKPAASADHIDSWVAIEAASWIDSVDDQRRGLAGSDSRARTIPGTRPPSSSNGTATRHRAR